MAARRKPQSPAAPLRGRFVGGVHPALEQIDRSLDVDRRLWQEDIRGSLAHAEMLGRTGILPLASVKRIVTGLRKIEKEFAADAFPFAESDVDVHMAIERRLVELIGPDGARLHVGRSRNDQVATDLKLYLLALGQRVAASLGALQRVLVLRAGEESDSLVPFYTHLQRAQPVVMGHVLLAYVEMLEPERQALLALSFACPLGAGAGAGTTFPLDRRDTARQLGFREPTRNSLESVSSRRDASLVLFHLAMAATTLSRLGADLVLWTSREFGFLRLDDRVSTGSSIMPQKRNPDGAELMRAKAVRVQGALAALLELQRGLPLGYFKDLQEDKSYLFAAGDAVLEMLAVAQAMFEHAAFDRARMRAAVEDPAGYLLATEVADALVQRGVPFREAHEAVGLLVRLAEARGVGLESLTDAELAGAHEALGPDVRTALDPARAVARRTVLGGPAPANVRREAARWRKILGST